MQAPEVAKEAEHPLANINSPLLNLSPRADTLGRTSLLPLEKPGKNYGKTSLLAKHFDTLQQLMVLQERGKQFAAAMSAA